MGAEVTAADVSAEALRRAALRAPTATIVRLRRGRELPFAEDAFDLVWLGETIEHVADVAGMLAEVRRVLRWGGELLLTTPNPGSPRRSRSTRCAAGRSSKGSIRGQITCASSPCGRCARC